jgi:hypothetical protein
VHARDRAARGGTVVPSRRVLGSEESMETPLDHLRLVSLGVRVTADERDRRADVFLADPDTATVLDLRKDWRFGEKETPLPGAKLATRVVAVRATLDVMARANVVTASASRRANRLLTLKESRVVRTSVVRSKGDWESLPEPLRVPDVAALDAAMRERPPRMIRPRILAESVHAIEIGQVHDVSYAPGEQVLGALVTDPRGNELVIRLGHRSVAAGALDLLAHALSGERGKVRYASGSVKRTPRGLLLEPLSIVTEEGIHALDLAPEESKHPVETEIDDGGDVGGRPGLIRAGELLAEVAHRGLRHAPPGLVDRFTDARAALVREGLTRMAERIASLTTAMQRSRREGGEDAEQAVARAWIDARIRQRLTEEVG